MSKKQNESFQLKPKHLIRAAFAISIIAVGALIVGVIGTLNTKPDTSNTQSAQPASKDEGVEVWRPNGTVEPKKIIAGSKDETSEQEKTTSQNPVIPPQNQSENRRTKAQPDAKNKDKKTTSTTKHRPRRQKQWKSKPNLPKVPLRSNHRPKPLPSLPKPKYTKRRANLNPHRTPLPSRFSLNPLNLNRFSPNLSPKMSWTIYFNRTTRRPAAALSVICIPSLSDDLCAATRSSETIKETT